MNVRLRTAIFIVAAAGAAALAAWGGSGLPRFGHYPGPYGDQVIQKAEPLRHATNAVTTVVMDMRAVDTAGEEMILLAAAVGVLMLLRKLAGERDVEPRDNIAGRRFDPSSPVRTVSAALVAPVMLLGLYIVFHGQLTPGGGFQGGVILAAPSILVFLAARYRSYERLHVPVRWEIAQAICVSAFLGLGFAGMIIAGPFLQNVLPLGVTGTVFSAGNIPVLNVVAGPAVATAIVLIATELLQQVTEVRGP